MAESLEVRAEESREMSEKMEVGRCQARLGVSRVENVLEKEEMAHGCGSRKDDWLAEEEEVEAKEEAEMGTASEERSRAAGVEALVERRGETCAT